MSTNPTTVSPDALALQRRQLDAGAGRDAGTFAEAAHHSGIVTKSVRSALGLNQCTVAAGGAPPMPPELLRWYERLRLPILEVCGMAGNCGVSHATLPGVQRPGSDSALSGTASERGSPGPAGGQANAGR